MHLWHYRSCNISIVDCGALIPILSSTLDLSCTLTSLTYRSCLQFKLLYVGQTLSVFVLCLKRGKFTNSLIPAGENLAITYTMK